MSFKGGYKIIDFSGCEFTKDESQTTETSVVYTSAKAGIYDEFESTYGKMLVISGLVLEGVAADENITNRKYTSNGAISLYVTFPTTAAFAPAGKIVMGTNMDIEANDKITIKVTLV